MNIAIDTDSAKMGCIKPLKVNTVHKICSGQVVLSLAVAVKELVENSLDAGATNIDIKFKNYGIEVIEVSDNGSGVTEDNFAALTLKHHTSKLSEYSDLMDVSSFGFRGEALSSLCALANLVITTRHQSSEYANKIEYDHKGIITKMTPCSRQVGTTVTLSNLFYSLPVREKEFHKNVKREFNKMTQMLYAYCLISVGVKFTCSNQTNSHARTLVAATQGSVSYKDNIASIFGMKQLQSILEIKPENVNNIKENIFKGLSQEAEENQECSDIADIEIDLSEDSNDADNNESKDSIGCSQKSQGYMNKSIPIEFVGFISSCAHGSGRSCTDRQFYYINSRPCEPTKVMKLINEIYKQYNPNQYPFLFLNINLDRASVDVNVTPDKRKLFLTKEKVVLAVLKNSILKLFESIPRTLKLETNICSKKSNDVVKPVIEQPRIFNSFLQQFGNKTKSYLSDKKHNNKTELKRKSMTILDFASSKVKKTQSCIEEDDERTDSELSNKVHDIKTDSEINISESDSEVVNIDDKGNKYTSFCMSDGNIKDENTLEENINNSVQYENSNFGETVNDSIQAKKEDIMYLEFTDKLPNTQIRNITDVVINNSHTSFKMKKINSKTNVSTANPAKVVTDKEDLGKYNRKTVILKTSLEHVKALADMCNKQNAKSVPNRIRFKSTINPVFNKKCEEELSKEISKECFKQMNIIGQFNLGFIITKLDEDLFIIDQHATDEIYNFETLQKITELTNQKLVIPQLLELSGVNEQVLMDNLDVFKKNGFTFDINMDAPLTKRVKLLTLPMSKNWVFGKEDIEELLFMLRESPSEFCRPSRVRAMFASRACRKSVMIGTALNKSDMRKLVDHMSEIDKPWNCPHGRPTIRHLVNLAMVRNCDEE